MTLIENLSDWPILHALGASDVVLEMYKKGWEGHLQQYTQARTKQVPFARNGMYYREFPVMFDWLHNGEGLTPFDLQGLADPNDAKFQARVRRFAGFYVGEDPEAPNYDAAHKIIRSMFNGSRTGKPAVAKGDGRRLGRRSDRGRRPLQTAARGTQLRPNARALREVQRHRGRQSDQSRIDLARL